MRVMLTLLCSVGVAGCQTTIAFENQLPGVVIEEITFDNGDEVAGHFWPLAPGENSDEVRITGERAGLPGRVEFLLNIDGRRVLLEAEEPFDPEDFGHRTFVLTADTPVRSPLIGDDEEVEE